MDRFLRTCGVATLLTLALACAHPSGMAEQGGLEAPPTPRAAPAARAADVASPDALLAATYDVISGPAGQPRDWDRFRSLFLPGARLIPTGPKEVGSGVAARVYTVEEYIARASPYFLKEGFFERESSRRTDRYGNILQAFSTYESRHRPEDKPFARGINSFQLFFDGTRWWLVTIFWEAETPETPIPGEFLPQ